MRNVQILFKTEAFGVNTRCLVQLLTRSMHYGARGGGQSSPKFRFSVFKRKLQEIQPQNLIIICWYGCCGYGEVGIDPKMGGGTPGGSSMLKKLRNVQILFKT